MPNPLIRYAIYTTSDRWGKPNFEPGYSQYMNTAQAKAVKHSQRHKGITVFVWDCWALMRVWDTTMRVG